MDTLSPEARSARMALVRNRENASTELKLAKLFRAARVSGWRRHQPLPGKPDFVFRTKKVAVFVDGDFWHGNPAKLRIPKSRVEFWKSKISRNQTRDAEVTAALSMLGWTVIRIWESDLARQPLACVERVAAALREDKPLPRLSGKANPRS